MGSKELSADLRNRIVSRHRSGEGYGKISAALQVPKSTVATKICKCKKFGTTKNLPRPGRPAKLSYQERRALAREVSRNPRVSGVLQRILVEMGEPFRRSTIQAALHTSGLMVEWPDRSPSLVKGTSQPAWILPKGTWRTLKQWQSRFSGLKKPKFDFLAWIPNVMSGGNRGKISSLEGLEHDSEIKNGELTSAWHP